MAVRLKKPFLCILCILVFTACGSSNVQRATIVPPNTSVAAPRHAASATNPDEAVARPIEIQPTHRRYLVDTSRSHFEVFGKGTLGGEYKMTFTAWQAHVYIEPNHPRIKVSVETNSVQLDIAGATGIARSQLLEAQRFPTARLEGTLSRTDGPPEEHLVEGIADLHGVRRTLRFLGTLREEGEGYRFQTEFLLSRKEFDIHYSPVEPFLKDDVRIVVDAYAKPVLDDAGGGSDVAQPTDAQ